MPGLYRPPRTPGILAQQILRERIHGTGDEETSVDSDTDDTCSRNARERGIGSPPFLPTLHLAKRGHS
jgi:hypothetical protein